MCCQTEREIHLSLELEIKLNYPDSIYIIISGAANEYI